MLRIVLLAAILLAGPREATAAQAAEVESRRVDIWSDYTRLSADLFYPKGARAGDNLPAIILCHGWGGLRANLNLGYAPAFARAGYVVLTFDYRGWGDSDSRLIIAGPAPRPDENGELTVRARIVREIVDPRDQTEDIVSAINFISGEPMVNPDRIGLWGSSFGGGNVVSVSAQDSRVKSMVIQVASLHHRWISKEKVKQQAIARARSETDQLPPGTDRLKGLKGIPNYVRMAASHPIDLADRVKIPVLIIDAENEELFNTKEHGKALHGLLKNRVPVRYEVVPGTHYDIYTKSRESATRLAIEWFDQYLKKK
ncbi:MAG: hypothetical protein A2W26_08695 [Acidobacteria bacterium RBG_16_64_8]|nr:MAG: hypothetical protein A2W26_08695 [Acidobacteria bacterium RBG_16_64_8]